MLNTNFQVARRGHFSLLYRSSKEGCSISYTFLSRGCKRGLSRGASFLTIQWALRTKGQRRGGGEEILSSCIWQFSWCIPVENEEEKRSSFEGGYVDLLLCRNSLIALYVEKLLFVAVGHKFDSTRLSRTNIGPGRKGGKVKSKRIWHEKEIRFR